MLNADVCSDFPLNAMLDAHRRQRHPFLLLGTTVRGLVSVKGADPERFLECRCQGGRGRPGGCRGQSGVSRATQGPSSNRGGAGDPSPSTAPTWEGEGSCQLSPMPKTCQWQHRGAACQVPQGRERRNRKTDVAAPGLAGHRLRCICLSGQQDTVPQLRLHR